MRKHIYYYMRKKCNDASRAICAGHHASSTYTSRNKNNKFD